MGLVLAAFSSCNAAGPDLRAPVLRLNAAGGARKYPSAGSARGGRASGATGRVGVARGWIDVESKAKKGEVLSIHAPIGILS